jgi:hypothetical protein
MGHHSSNSFDDDPRLKELFSDILRSDILRLDPRELLRQQFGATGRFPMGKLTETDEGEIAFGVAADKKTGKVIINFGKPTAWLGMDREQALALAESLKSKADDLLDVSK